METFKIPITYDVPGLYHTRVDMEAFVKVEAETRAEAERAALDRFREGVRVGPQTRSTTSYTVEVDYNPGGIRPQRICYLEIEAACEEDAAGEALETVGESLSAIVTPTERTNQPKETN